MKCKTRTGGNGDIPDFASEMAKAGMSLFPPPFFRYDKPYVQRWLRGIRTRVVGWRLLYRRRRGAWKPVRRALRNGRLPCAGLGRRTAAERPGSRRIDRGGLQPALQ